jgi:hypothetical protein
VKRIIVDTAVNGSDPEPDEDEIAIESTYTCFDRLPPDTQAALIERYGSEEAVKRNPFFADC